MQVQRCIGAEVHRCTGSGAQVQVHRCRWTGGQVLHRCTGAGAGGEVQVHRFQVQIRRCTPGAGAEVQRCRVRYTGAGAQVILVVILQVLRFHRGGAVAWCRGTGGVYRCWFRWV